MFHILDPATGKTLSMPMTEANGVFSDLNPAKVEKFKEAKVLRTEETSNGLEYVLEAFRDDGNKVVVKYNLFISKERYVLDRLQGLDKDGDMVLDCSLSYANAPKYGLVPVRIETLVRTAPMEIHTETKILKNEYNTGLNDGLFEIEPKGTK